MWGFFWFLLGVILTVYSILIMRKKAKTKVIGDEAESIVKFYLNIFILNKDDAIKTVVKQKVSNKVVGSVIGTLVASRMSDDAFAETMGKKMSEIIPSKLEEVGITATADISYQQGAYICVKIDFLKADARKLIAKRGGKEQLAKFNYFMDLIGIPQFNDSIDNSLGSIIGEKMQTNLPMGLKERMQEKAGLDVRVVACSEEEQAAFLLLTLKELNKER